MRIVLTGHPDVLIWHLETALRDLKEGGQSLWAVMPEDGGFEIPREIRFAADSEGFKPSDPLYVEKD